MCDIKPRFKKIHGYTLIKIKYEKNFKNVSKTGNVMWAVLSKK